jgi:phospholipid/cholesterol/gamma-HCH transport system substrate-binding protein
MDRSEADKKRTAHLRAGVGVRPTAPKAPLGERIVGGVRWMLVHPWIPLLILGVVVFTLWVISTRSEPYQVRAVFAQAPNLYTGEDVQVDGIDVGKVTSENYVNGQAVVGVGISDRQYSPLHQGTKVILRFGTTIGNGSRYIQVVPGPKSAPAIPNGGIVPIADTVESVEFDQLFNVFNAPTRSAFRAASTGAGNVFGSRAAQLGAGVSAGGPALDALSGFTAELARDQQSLSSLVANGASLTQTLAAHDTQIADLVSNAAGTFNAFASNTSGISRSLDLLPPTLTQVQGTLSRLSGSIGHLNGLVTALAPGAAQLRTMAADLLPAMTDLRATIPVADQTLQVGTSASPQITTLLKEAQPFSKQASPAFTKLAPMVACIRPYAPELAGLLTTWSSWTQDYDQIGHLGRLDGYTGLASLTSSPENSATYAQLSGQGYALIRPPGFNSGQTWFQPQCGDTQAGLTAADDPEAKAGTP